jgi:glycosyltransferase involved in cell wall biosynthesis
VLRVVIGLNQGGVQQGVLNLFRGLDRRRFRPIACAVENDGAVGAEIAAEGFEVVTLGHKRKGVRIVRDLVRLIREREVRIVHGSSYHPSLYARLAGWLAGAPILVSHEHTVFPRRRLRRCLWSHLLGRVTDAHVAVSAAVRDQVVAWYGLDPARVRVVYNGVDPARFRPATSRADAKRRLGLPPEAFTLVTTSRLDPENGHRFLFDAVAPLQTRLDLRVVVVGTGRGEAAVREAAHACGLGGGLTFTGLRRDIPDLLAAADVYVAPMLQAGFSNAVLEAMAAGCAIIATDLAGNTEAVRHEGEALLVPPRDAGAIRGAVERLHADAALRERLAAAARERVLCRFTVEQFASQMQDLYDGLLSRKGV